MKPYRDGIITFKNSKSAYEAHCEFKGKTLPFEVATTDGTAKIEMRDFRETPEPSDMNYDNLG